jgi:hypothetical protein
MMQPHISPKSEGLSSITHKPHSDTKIRISEPEVKAPWAISLAMLFTYLAGFLFNIVLCFCMVLVSP